MCDELVRLDRGNATVSLRHIVASVQPGSGSRVVLAGQGNMLRALQQMPGRPAALLTLNPLVDHHARWDISTDIGSLAMATELADALVPESRGGGAHGYFRPAAVQTLAAITSRLMRQHRDRRWTFSELLQTAFLFEKFQAVVSASDCGYMYSPECLVQVHATLALQLQDYRPFLEDHAHQSLSITEWARSESILELSTGGTERLHGFFLHLLCSQLRDSEEACGHTTWIVLGDLTHLGTVSLLASSGLNGARVVVQPKDLAAAQNFLATGSTP